MTSFHDVFRAFPWRPIPNCPGRYRLANRAGPDLAELFADTPPQAFRVAAARDEVLLVVFADGAGLLSYRRSDGTLLHTLNTPEGLARKLAQLGLATGRSSAR